MMAPVSAKAIAIAGGGVALGVFLTLCMAVYIPFVVTLRRYAGGDWHPADGG